MLSAAVPQAREREREKRGFLSDCRPNAVGSTESGWYRWGKGLFVVIMFIVAGLIGSDQSEYGRCRSSSMLTPLKYEIFL